MLDFRDLCWKLVIFSVSKAVSSHVYQTARGGKKKKKEVVSTSGKQVFLANVEQYDSKMYYNYNPTCSSSPWWLLLPFYQDFLF